MIFKIFNTNQPYVLILFLFIELAVWGFSFFTGENVQISSHQYNTIFGNFLADFNANNHLLSKIIAFILLFLQAIYLTWLNKKYFFISKRTYLPAIIYLLAISSFRQYQELYGVIISNTFFLLIINEIFSVYKKRTAITSYFNIGILFTIVVLLYGNFVFYMPILWISFVILRPVNIREWISGFVGFLTPILIFVLSYYIFFFNGEITWVDYAYLFKNANLISFNLYELIYIGILSLLLILGMLNLLRRYDNKKISTRKYIQIFIWTVLLSPVIYFVIHFVDARIFIPAAIPIAYLLTMFLTNVRSKIFQEIAFALLLVGSLILQIL